MVKNIASKTKRSAEVRESAKVKLIKIETAIKPKSGTGFLPKRSAEKATQALKRYRPNAFGWLNPRAYRVIPPRTNTLFSITPKPADNIVIIRVAKDTVNAIFARGRILTLFAQTKNIEAQNNELSPD